MRITKITAGILALTVPMAIVASADSSENTIIKDGIEYTKKDDGSVRVTRIINKELTDVIIPAEVEGYKVTELGIARGSNGENGINVFEDCENVTVVMLPASIGSIGDYCFHGVLGLKDVYFAGTAEQFREMYIGDENDSLIDAVFHFDSGIPDIDDIPDLDIMGDVNGDGIVSARDATMILKYNIGAVTLDDATLKNADMDGDNKVTARDATAILKQSVGIK
ncbi:MAG: dockerin type I repeat-containing protein [Oscillospiraceae bacterium]|nr:dockerin type I repeat-containing protein [Oscillospiraceae bacterium]